MNLIKVMSIKFIKFDSINKKYVQSSLLSLSQLINFMFNELIKIMFNQVY
jgi:hypothetical protein